ncbi:hypothetical protein M378DRAFT_159939 [Amanita muscaria Koide BX008]|uniref:Uncharacterized protein n=1 Tax=Amanita muscaria (strain Koide BX008) TaxID=946122 RepID=A0A0C2SUC3_AMAMK|nr:hypothetical protein M378DRAFT_159939 [Amanita muscaria Koide BX008]
MPWLLYWVLVAISLFQTPIRQFCGLIHGMTAKLGAHSYYYKLRSGASADSVDTTNN